MKYIIFFILLSTNIYSQGTASAVSTFNCLGIYWSGSGQTAAEASVKYRKVGDANYSQGYPLWRDSRSIGGRPAGEYRGSIVNLQPGTQYEIILSAGTSTNTFTASTWSENFPVGSTTNLGSSTTISTSGTQTSYRVYTGSISGGSNNLTINASYIIIRNMTLSGATNDAIVLGANAHDVIIEGCDISGWGQSASTLGGNNQAAIRVQGFSYNAKGVQRIIIQRNKIHDPRYSASSWDAGSTHPYGVSAINFEEAGGNQVFRYNELYSSGGKKFMDGIGGADNFTTTGFPGANSDIYGNSIDGTWDDGIEAEGSGCNVRIWGNWLNNTFTGIATATVSVGPIYVWENITNVGQRLNSTSSSTLDNEDRGPFNKCGSQDASVRGGRAYLFHNTILQPKQSGYANTRGLCGGIVDNGGQVTNIVSKNNIWTSAYTSKGGLPIAMWQGGGQNCNSDHDLLAPNSTTGTFTITSKITGNPVYSSSVPLTRDDNGYFLTSASPGFGAGVSIPNFNDGVNVDVGAFQNGEAKLEFGVNAGLIVTPPPVVNLAPVANAGIDQTIQLPANTVTLTGSGNDPDGMVTSYSWSEGSTILTNSQNFTATYSTAGVHTYRLTVTDDKGATGFDDIKVTVLAAVPPPVTKFLVRVEITTKAVYSDSTSQTIINVIK